MKIQCSCGTKYAFEITPDMLANPVRLLCQNCGADISPLVNQIIQQQFGESSAEFAATPAPAPPTPTVPAPRLRVNVHTAPAARAAPEAVASAAPELCRKHPGQFTIDHCRVCQKPICPQCMEVFGYVCSAFCKNEAEQRAIELPVYENQFGAVAARSTRKLARVVFTVIALLVLLLGGYGWFLFSGSKPRVVFSATFSTPAYNGAGKLLGDEAVLLHGGHLARYDLKSKKEVWGVDLIDTNGVNAQAEAAVVKESDELEYWKKNLQTAGSTAPRRHSKEEFYHVALAGAQSGYTLHVHEQNIWLRTRDKLTQYDWATGKPGREVFLHGYVERAVASQDSLLIFLRTNAGEELTKVDLKSGEMQTQQISERPRLAGTGGSNRVALAARAGGANSALKGYKVAQPDSLPQRIAAPAIAANTVQNKRIERELKEDEDSVTPAFEFDSSRQQFINDNGTLVEFSAKLLERKTIDRQAMKAPPKKSALDGEVNQAATMAIANEIMNDFQREATGGIEKVDASRYEVTIKRRGADTAEVKMEVVGHPEFFPLATVDLLVAGQSLTVLDKAGKKLWESKLNFEIASGFGGGSWNGELIATATAPAVERGNLLYFFDKGVLSCFDLATGNARWRQPTVGVTKLMFDHAGMLYVDATSGSVDSVRYSQQIDVSDKKYPVILKMDPKTGKTLWRSQQNGRLSHVFGKLIYTIEWHGGDEDAEPSTYGLPGLQTPPHIRIRRLSASDGKPKWEYYQKRAPISVDIQNNTIQLMFKKEMQVLKFIAL
jgi:hypothetical protein